jgi:impB/mucB/samB family
LRVSTYNPAPQMNEGRIRKIIHVDMDAFYASVEQRDDATLRGKPVAVGHPAKRGVVAAASYEARAFGVRSAMPSIVAARKCAELVFVPPRFDVYREVSRQVQAIFRDYTPLVEPLSLDEAYLDVTDNLKGIPTAWETAKQIRARIYEETKLTASAGISGQFDGWTVALCAEYALNAAIILSSQVKGSAAAPRALRRHDAPKASSTQGCIYWTQSGVTATASGPLFLPTG